MTVQTEVSRSGPYAGAGTTGPFTVGFRFLADSHLRVIRTSAAGVDTDLVLTTDYSVAGAGAESGTVTLAVALPIGASLTIIRDVPFTQEADYVDNDSFPAESHETALDKLTMQTQQIREAQDRAVALSPTSTGVSTELPPAVANNLIGWNSAGDGLENLDPAGLAGLVSYGTFRVDVFSANGVGTDFVLTGDALLSANCDVVANGVAQTPDVNFIYIGSTKTVRFITGAPPAGTNNVFVRYGSVLDVGYAAGIDGQTAVGTALIKAVDAAAARSAMLAAKSGANSDITSLLGLTTPLSVAQGGTGSNARALTSDVAARTDTAKYLTSQALQGLLVLGTPVATTSGTAINFTSIPAWVKRITVMLSGVSTNGASTIVLRLGGSGGIENTGYVGGAVFSVNGAVGAGTSATDGFPLVTSAASIISGSIVLTLFDPATNTWIASGSLAQSNTSASVAIGGSKSTSAALDRVRITTVGGADTFDAGIVNILYE